MFQIMTVNPATSTNASHANQLNQASQQAARLTQNQPQTQQSNALPQDTVTLSRAAQQGQAAPKSAGDVDHDGDNH
jgi:hypothetical protein